MVQQQATTSRRSTGVMDRFPRRGSTSGWLLAPFSFSRCLPPWLPPRKCLSRSDARQGPLLPPQAKLEATPAWMPICIDGHGSGPARNVAELYRAVSLLLCSTATTAMPCLSFAASSADSSMEVSPATARAGGSNHWGRFSRVNCSGRQASSSRKAPMAVRSKADITAAVPSDAARSRPSARTYVPEPHSIFTTSSGYS